MTQVVIPIVTPPAEITAETVAAFQSDAAPHLEGSGPGLVVDMTAVTLVSSAGLTWFVQAGRALGTRGGGLALVGTRRSVTRLFQTVGLDKFMPLMRTVEEARTWILANARQRA